MQDNLFNSEFAKNSKFDESFVGNILNIEEWLFLVTQYKEYIKKPKFLDNSKVLIPKKIHQIWLGEKSIPKICKKWMKSWKDFNPQWEYKLWDEQNECLILPSNYFYPYPNFMLNKQINRYSEIEEISIDIHHWQMTLMKENIFNRIKNKLKAILENNFN